ncbi:MAG: lipoprotein-releasing ABC transporter permease subunit [Desulfovermiculus sp.]|nr:lipoprotein-releasing ABC transporter permease subunit [Desulfovermiculus sp.]
MRFELFIALRYLLSRRKHGFISAISLISVLGVALGVTALIVVLGVMNGFSDNLRDKILGVNSHIIVTNVSGPFADYRDIQDTIQGVDRIEASMPFIYTEVMLSTRQGVKGAAVRGIDPQQAGRVMSVQQDLIQGELADLSSTEEMPGIILGSALAARLGVQPGDTVNMLVPSGRSTAAGFTPQIKIFTVAGMFRTGMYEYDSSLAYISLQAAQESLGFTKDLVSGLEVRIQDVYAAEKVGQRIKQQLKNGGFTVQTWMDMNRSLFSALKLEKTAMAVILVMIVLVGSFSIITTLIMLVMDKKQDIAVLMSLGCQPGHIKRIFMLQGTIIGVVGTGLGFLGGLSLSALLQKYQFIKLPSDIYYLDHLPVKLELMDLGLIGLAALVLCFAATIYPARQAARVQPAEVLRYE